MSISASICREEKENFHQLISLKRLNVSVSEYSSTSLFSQTLEYNSSAGRSRGKNIL